VEVWKPLRPDALVALLEGFSRAWGFAGGYGLDLWLGRETRTHADLDITLFRESLGDLFSFLPEYEFHVAEAGRLRLLRGSCDLNPSEWNLWVRKRGEPDWLFQCLIADEDTGRWIYRRDARVRRAKEDFFRDSGSGLWVIAPEIQLLFKSPRRELKDTFDFMAVKDSLSAAQKEWLRSSLATVFRNQHPWIAELSL